MEKELLEKMLNEKMSRAKISELTGKGETTISYWVKKHGLKFRSYKDYTDDDIINLSKEVTSMTQLLLKLNLRPAGGNYSCMKKRLQNLGITGDHWLGKGWNKNEQSKDWSNYHSIGSLRKILLHERGNKCEKCNISSWMDVPLKLEMHHIDGDRSHNDKTNLIILCPNCHSITDNFRGSNTKFSGQYAIPETEIEKISSLIWDKSKIEIAKIYNVCPSTVKYFCQNHKIKYPTISYWNSYRHGNFERCAMLKAQILNS